jgi:hypothetical protein
MFFLTFLTVDTTEIKAQTFVMLGKNEVTVSKFSIGLLISVQKNWNSCE